MSARSDRKAKKRAELRKLLAETKPNAKGQPQRESRYQHTCFSQTCADCGRVWIAAAKPIALNAKRDGRKVYLCWRCR